MKKNLLIVLIFTLLFSCNNSSDKTTTEGTQVQGPVENVNGNIPDTSNAIKLDVHKKDSTSSSKDSSKK